MGAAAIWLVMSGALVLGGTKECSQAEAIAADKSLEHLNSWLDIQDAFRRFGYCDHGGVAAGYSDRIMRMLSRRWSTVTDLDRLMRPDPKFRAFVLRHIDETWVNTEFNRVMDLAATQCPSDAPRICAAIVKRGKEVNDGIAKQH
jgi:hypothetical protein